MTSGVANFTGPCGECKSGYYTATSTGGMQPNQSATVNGNSPQNCVIANDGGTVFDIELQSVAGVYNYQLRVQAQGPKGVFSGSMYLAFEDRTGDVYYLSVFSSTKEWHQVSYNSARPEIVAIYWSNHSFTVDKGAAAKDKPQYKVMSPVA